MGSAILTLFAFGAMIFIHELGHYLAAIRVGVRVEKFYLGFDFWGMKLFKFHHKGTEYGIGIFPLGGYVKMAGQEDMGKAKVTGSPDEFTSKNVWERSQILVAGVVFNFVSAFIFSGLALYLGYRLISPEIGGVLPGGPAWKAGLVKGDRVLSYDGVPTTSFESLRTEVALGGYGEKVSVKIEREGEVKKLWIQPSMGPMDMPSIGIEPQRSLRVLKVIREYPAYEAGLRPGDTLKSVNGVPLDRWEELSPLIQSLADTQKNVKVSFLRDGGEQDVSIPLIKEKRPLLGVRPQLGRQVLDVHPGSDLFKNGVRKGMVLQTINGHDFVDILSLDEKLNIHSLGFKSLQNKLELKFNGTLKDIFDVLYFGDVMDLKKVILSEVSTGSTAEEMGLQVGDEILNLNIEGLPEINGPSWLDLLNAVSKASGKKCELLVKRDELELKLQTKIAEAGTGRVVLGLMPDYEEAKATASTALLWPFHMLRQTYKGMLSLVTGKVDLKHVSGPVGILKVTYLTAEAGLSKLVYLMALLSINLAFLNILPLPVLDGGHLLFCLIEWIKGSPVSEAVMEKAQMAGLAMLLTLFLFATWNDLFQHIL